MSYWFKRPSASWGYTPIVWQGWVVVVSLGVLLIAGAIAATVIPGTAVELVLILWIVVLCWVGLRIMIAKTPPKEEKKFGSR